MFGIKRMHQQRERLFLRTQLLEKRAKASRDKAIDKALEKATSPEGLIASFVLGATTQLDITRKARKNLLNGASRDVLSFLISQVSAYMTAESPKQEDSAEAEDAPKTSDSTENIPDSGVIKTDQDIEEVFPEKRKV
ncbi:hypothetical protein KDW99_15050 [Marinomonas rhizomae]|uniref:hypothetical protein n=1 Tax=Marinomonas rhizomae TaxID=491948 RepID=UPI0021060F36|nr:hypothetical protein [Marinomonas rhizomae]UTV98564.1 hypothetical protein KDW99_15050 [Marinomonas rhizomae]